MALLPSTVRLAQRLPRIQFIPSRTAAWWNKDYKPGRYPRTKDDCDAAAKKYYLFPEEYRPYYDRGQYYGDYPRLPAGIDGLGVESLDPYYPYDYPEHKRNLHEPIHADIDLYGEHRWSLPEKPALKNWQFFASFFGVMGFCIALYYTLERMPMFRPVMPKQLARFGPHYTFEAKPPEPKKKKSFF